ncbi:MAG: ATP-binding protein [candidate division NC10 bacterium]
MIAMVAHAIIRHRLMDIRVVIKRGAVYLAAFVAAGLILGALLVGSNLLFHDEPQVPLREILIALVVAVLFHPLKGRIQQVFDRYLYREPYDYQRTVRQASRTLTGTIDLPTLLGHVSAVVSQTLRPEGLAIYLLDEEEGLFERAFSSGGAPGPAALPAASPLPDALSRDRKLVFRDELGHEAGARDGQGVLADLSRLGAEVIVPLLEEDRLIGFLSVGAKRSGDPYFSDDADLLTTLANQSAIAIRNAQVHQQVVQVNEDIGKILGTIDSGVISIGPKGRVTLFNRAAELLTAAPAGTLRGQPVDHLPAPLAHLIDATVRDGQSRSQMEIALPDAAGQLVPIMCSTSPLGGPQGVTIGTVAVFSDLSRLKELEQEKRRAERLASLEAIASGMVHEIRNPLVSLKAFIQLLPARHQEPEFRERFMGIMEREINRIDDLLGRFRTLASAASQPMEPVKIPTPLGATLELLEPEMQARHIRLRQVADGNPRPVLGNASQLQQLFHNLCLNAIEAMKPGGELTVRVADLIECGGMTLHVEVSDTGPGIPEDLLPRIFNPFVTTKSRGSGLGLAICSSIADAHRATLRARNNPHRSGATFTVEFPVIAERAARVTT